MNEIQITFTSIGFNVFPSHIIFMFILVCASDFFSRSTAVPIFARSEFNKPLSNVSNDKPFFSPNRLLNNN